MEELTRLHQELGVNQRGSSGGALAGTAKYEEIVGPVIEEYEKTISAMEAELSLNWAALRHTNEMVEEKEVLLERHVATEFYVKDLRARVVKLSEKESSTEVNISYFIIVGCNNLNITGVCSRPRREDQVI